MSENIETNSWLMRNLPQNCVLDGFCGEGGMGVVFRVMHQDWGIPLAVKTPKKSQHSDEVKQFLEETEIWADMGLHSYVATLYYVRDLDSRFCTFSELVENGGLDRVLRTRNHRGSDEAVTLSRILSLSASTAWGLGAAHTAGLVHCDFKPGNVLVESDFTAKITDFGLARRNKDGSFACPGGTPLYASPEQARGDQLTAATDFWSWAATCFEMFIDGPSWQSGAAAGAAFQEYVDSGAKFPGYPQMPESIIKVLHNCFETKARERPSSFNQIAEELCDIHSTLLDEPCPAGKPDVAFLAADSLNNRAVSLLDIGNVPRASILLKEALQADPYHPEAIFNLFVVLGIHDSTSIVKAKALLEAAAKLDSFNPVPCELLANLYNHLNDREKANSWLRKAGERGNGDIHKIPILEKSRMVPVLARPMSGDDHVYNQTRFFRLMGKAENSISDQDNENASRYVLMAGDIPGFARHPTLHKLRSQLSRLTLRL